MKIGDMVRTKFFQNVGIVFECKGDYAKVLLDKHRADDIRSMQENPLFLKKPKDLNRASWYHFKELEVARGFVRSMKRSGF